MTLRVVFMGTPEFAVPSLQALITHSFSNVIAVYTQPPRPKGRGGVIQKSPVHVLADEHNIPVFNPLSFKKDAAAVEQFRNLNADIAIVAAYGLILPISVLSAPRLGCINIHGSLLPRWRGASPVQQAILHGDVETGITLMQMDEGLDTGGMIAKISTPIESQDTTVTLMTRLSHIGHDMILKFFDDLAFDKTYEAIPQNSELSCYAGMIKKQDGIIDWAQSAIVIDRKIRAFTPWPSCVTHTHKGTLKIISGEVLNTPHDTQIGTVLNDKGDVACGEKTVYRMIMVQPENSKAMTLSSAINGGYVSVGDVLT